MCKVRDFVSLSPKWVSFSKPPLKAQGSLQKSIWEENRSQNWSTDNKKSRFAVRSELIHIWPHKDCGNTHDSCTCLSQTESYNRQELDTGSLPSNQTSICNQYLRLGKINHSSSMECSWVYQSQTYTKKWLANAKQTVWFLSAFLKCGLVCFSACLFYISFRKTH